MLKILYVIPRLAKAGTENHLLNLACTLDGKKFDVTICCLFEVGELNKQYNKFGFKLVCLHRSNVYDPRVMIDLYRLIKKEQYNIVHTYLFGFHFLATIPAKILRTPLIITSRREIPLWKKPHHFLLENIGNIFTDKVIACSEAVKRHALKTENLREVKIITIYNGIDINKFYPKQKSEKILMEFEILKSDKILGMVANFSQVKDHTTLLKALVEIKKDYPAIKCFLVGDGPLKKDLEKKTRDIKLDENVRFVGLRDDIAQILSIMDIFILTSLSEGLPNVILEAMACGLPVVACKVGGITEIVEDKTSGILIEPNNCFQISLAILKLLKDVNLRLKLGKRGREIVEAKFSLMRSVKEYENFYYFELNKKMISCPICKAKKNKIIFEKDGCVFVKCKFCGIAFVWPQPESQKSEQIYQEWGKYYYLNENKISIDYSSSFTERLNQLHQYRKYNRLLDVGCSIGAFLLASKNDGWNAYGVEISQASANFAEKEKGLNVFCGTLRQANFPSEYFDVVNIWAVLEHVSDPLSVLSESYRVLRPGGILVACVPNFNSLPLRLLGKRYRYACREHLFYFTVDSLYRLLRSIGFKIVMISSDYFSLLGFFEDFIGAKPDTLATQKSEKRRISELKNSSKYFLMKPIWKSFMFMIRKLYLGEELRVLVIK